MPPVELEDEDEELDELELLLELDELLELELLELELELLEPVSGGVVGWGEPQAESAVANSAEQVYWIRRLPGGLVNMEYIGCVLSVYGSSHGWLARYYWS